jgi:uncharacterized protein (UPF0333 family)
MKRKGQAAMEFLMTYGWAIIVVLAAIAALAYFGVLSPQKLLPERTTFAAPMSNVDNAIISASANSVEIAFRNNVGVAVTFPLTGSLTTGTGTTCENAVVTVSSDTDGDGDLDALLATDKVENGEGFVVNWNCDDLIPVPKAGSKFKADSLAFNYVNTETLQSKSQSGTVDGKYQ